MTLLLRIVFYPFSIIYGLIMLIRNILFDLGVLKEQTFNIPIISVGNITVGGTGKTPHVEYIANLLKKEGYIVGVLSRGYGRKTKGYILASKNSSSFEIGDEPKQLKNKYPDLIVAVDEDRCHGIEKLINDTLIDVIILDDAFQHRYVKPGMSIIINDFNRPMYYDFVFPAGRLREFPSGRKRSQIIIESKCPTKLDYKEKQIIERSLCNNKQEIYYTYYDYSPLVGIWTSKRESVNKKSDILLVTGIASPKLIEKYLNLNDISYKSINYPDHHIFSISDYKEIKSSFDQISNEFKFILTTEKDAVRFKDDSNFPKELKSEIFVLPLDLQFIENREKFNLRIKDYVRTYKRNS